MRHKMAFTVAPPFDHQRIQRSSPRRFHGKFVERNSKPTTKLTIQITMFNDNQQQRLIVEKFAPYTIPVTFSWKAISYPLRPMQNWSSKWKSRRCIPCHPGCDPRTAMGVIKYSKWKLVLGAIYPSERKCYVFIMRLEIYYNFGDKRVLDDLHFLLCPRLDCLPSFEESDRIVRRWYIVVKVCTMLQFLCTCMNISIA